MLRGFDCCCSGRGGKLRVCCASRWMQSEGRHDVSHMLLRNRTDADPQGWALACGMRRGIACPREGLRELQRSRPGNADLSECAERIGAGATARFTGPAVVEGATTASMLCGLPR